MKNYNVKEILKSDQALAFSNYLKKQGFDYLFITAPENIAWLLNIRGYDNPNSPIPNCRLILTKNKKISI